MQKQKNKNETGVRERTRRKNETLNESTDATNTIDLLKVVKMNIPGFEYSRDSFLTQPTCTSVAS